MGLRKSYNNNSNTQIHRKNRSNKQLGLNNDNMKNNEYHEDDIELQKIAHFTQDDLEKQKEENLEKIRQILHENGHTFESIEKSIEKSISNLSDLPPDLEKMIENQIEMRIQQRLAELEENGI